jgi:hypothetical protein
MGNKINKPKQITVAGKVMPAYFIPNAELTEADVKIAR